MESTSEDCAIQGSNIPAYRMVGTIIFIVFILFLANGKSLTTPLQIQTS